MASAKAYKLGDSEAPEYPAEFDVLKKAVLQVTDIKTNRNKYYAIELHQAGGSFRVFTHYGRTDDLENDPDAGAKESRFFGDGHEAGACYESIYREKTSPKKGYKEVSLASSKIGSQKARGASVGEVDEKTIAKIAQQTKDRPAPKVSALPPSIQELVGCVYAEAASALTNTVAAKITANGIETPLGVLTVGQIERGEVILQELFHLFQAKKSAPDADAMERLSGEFYTCIPHRIGRTRAAVTEAIIDSMADFEQKQETLQLMKDMLNVNGDASVLYDSRIDDQYRALKCDLDVVAKDSSSYRELESFILKSQVKTKTIKVQNIYTVRRAQEWSAYDPSAGNERMLLHGSRIKNWLGLLSRGILLPKIAVSMGINRTDAGWLGSGIYFGDAACTSAFYTTPSRKGTRFMAVARVALGKPKKFHKITYGLSEPPAGYDSCHGVRHSILNRSEFADDEYVIYRTDRQRIEALVEFVN